MAKRKTGNGTKGQDGKPAGQGGGAETTSGVEVLPAAASEDVITGVVNTLNTMQRAAGFEFARAVGRVVLDSLYGGDLNGWRLRGESDASYRRLRDRAEAEKDKLLISAVALYRSMALVELEDRLQITDWKNLNITQVRSVFGLTDDQQRKLLTTAQAKGWDGERLEAEVAKVRKKEGDKRGRPPLPAFVKAIGAFRRVIEPGDGKPDPFGDLKLAEELDAEEAQALWQTVTGVKIKCEELQKTLAARIPGFAEPT